MLSFEIEDCFRAVSGGKTPRPGQLEAVEFAIQQYKDGKKHVVIEAPTGSGKSLIAMTVAEWVSRQMLRSRMNAEGQQVFYAGRSVVTTVTKELQEQYLSDFDSLRDIRGSQNELYRCEFGETRRTTECLTLVKDGKCKDSKKLIACPYRKAFRAFLASSFSLTNLQFFSKNKFNGEVNFLICDEAHETGQVVISQLEVKLSEVDVDKIAAALTPEELKMFKESYAELRAQFEELPDDFVGTIFPIKHAAALYTMLEMVIAKYEASPWILKSSRALQSAFNRIKTISGEMASICNLRMAEVARTSKYELKPVYPAQFADQMVFSKADFVVHLSATIGGFEAFCEELGIDVAKAAFFEMKHPIPEEMRLVHLRYCADMKAANYDSDVSKAARAISVLIKENGSKNTLIHTASYARAEDIAKTLKEMYDIEVHVPRSHSELTELLRRKNAGIFVASPSAVAGIDGKDDMIRLNIIAKLPFPSLGDPRLRYLSKVAPEVYALKVARDIVQAAGRGTRHQSDFSHTVILDGSFRYFVQRNRHLFPQWFLNALRS